MIPATRPSDAIRERNRRRGSRGRVRWEWDGDTEHRERASWYADRATERVGSLSALFPDPEARARPIAADDSRIGTIECEDHAYGAFVEIGAQARLPAHEVARGDGAVDDRVGMDGARGRGEWKPLASA